MTTISISTDYINFIIDNVTATLAIEGCKASNEAVTINKRFLEGKITSDEAIEMIKKVYRR